MEGGKGEGLLTSLQFGYSIVVLHVRAGGAVPFPLNTSSLTRKAIIVFQMCLYVVLVCQLAHSLCVCGMHAEAG